MKVRTVTSMLLHTLITVSILLFNVKAMSQESTDQIHDKISTHISNGDSENLSKHLGSTVELSMMSKDGTYSKTQCGYIIKDFFSKHPPSSYKLKHKGTSDKGSIYAIGNYVSGKETFRVYYMMKKESGEFQLVIIHFDKQN